MRPWLITGGNGFLGRHLIDRLLSIAGRPELVCAGLGSNPFPDSVRFVPLDLTDNAAFRRLLAGLRPEIVWHLAGLVPPAAAQRLYRVNTGLTASLLSALGQVGSTCRIILAGSAAELGPVPVEHLPAHEQIPCRPADPYGLSKYFATRLGRTAPSPLDVSIVRPFNPIGPGQPLTQVLGRFATLLAAPEGPEPLTLRVGPLETRRDFIDVRDVAAAFEAVAFRGQARQVYHVGQGVSRSLAEGLDQLIQLSRRRVQIESAGPFRPTGPLDSRACVDRIHAHTGWTPAFTWERSLQDLWHDIQHRSAAQPGTLRVA